MGLVYEKTEDRIIEFLMEESQEYIRVLSIWEIASRLSANCIKLRSYTAMSIDTPSSLKEDRDAKIIGFKASTTKFDRVGFQLES